METKLPGLIVEVEARIDKLERGLKRANAIQRGSSNEMERRADQSARRMQNSYGKAGDAVHASLKRMLLPLIGAGAIAGLGRNVGKAVSEIAKIGDAAKLAGVSTTALQEWKFVGDQNRIELDKVSDGLKELNLRADEFILTGSGPAADAFARLGYNATDLGMKLKDPSELLLEIFERMRSLDTAGRIRVSDEVFGGGAGERFVQLVDQGETGLRKTIERGRELGAVLDDDLIRKAQELDRRWAELTTRTSSWFKGFAVGAADVASQIAGLSADLDGMFRSRAQADSILGDGIAATLDADSAAAKANERAIGQLRNAYEGLSDDADGLSVQLQQASTLLSAWGYTEQAAGLASIADQMRSLSDGLQDGTVDAETFETGMQDLATAAQTAFAEIDAIDRAEFGNATSALGGFIAKLEQAVGIARSLRAALPGGDATGRAAPIVPAREVGSFWDDPANMALVNPPTSNAPTTSMRPQRAPAMLGEPDNAQDTPDTPASGGGRSQSDYAAALVSIANETSALQAESAALLAVAGSGKTYGDAIEFARAKSELLLAAQRSGVQVTPELDAKLDELAAGYAAAGLAAEQAANQILEVQAAGQRGAQAVADIFYNMASGAMTAKEALGQLVLQMLKVQMQKQMMEIAGNGGLLGDGLTAIGGLLGFASGGYTGRGSKHEPAGVVHKGEYVLSAKATRTLGVANLNGLHASALKGYSGGGLVGNGPKDILPGAGPSAAPQISISAPITINGSSGTPDQNNDLAKKMAREMEGSMRGAVQDELRKQLRPGNMLNTGKR